MLEEWLAVYNDADREFDFTTMCQNWHSGQFSAFYKLQCNGRILDSSHASDVYSECCSILRNINDRHEDYEAISELRMLADNYPSDGDDDEDAT